MMNKSLVTLVLSSALAATGAHTAHAGSTMVTDAAGTQELWTFESNQGVKLLTSKVNQIDGKGIAQTFDANNNLLTYTDTEGRITSYTYNANNQRISMTEASGTPQERITTYEYVSPSINLVTRTTEPSVFTGSVKETVNTYDANLNVTSTTTNGFSVLGQAVSRATSLTYNSAGQVIQIDAPRTDVNDVTTFTYYECNTGGECGQLQWVTNAKGHVTSYDSYDSNGRLLQSTDANGVITTYTYHPRGWLLSSTQTSGSGVRTTNYAYDNEGQLISSTSPDGVVITYVYDAAHDLRSMTDNMGNKVEYQYDAKGNQTHTKTFDPDGTLILESAMQYDIRNFVEQINSAGSITQLVTDAVGNISNEVDPNTNQSQKNYDALDRLQSSIDALTNTSSYQYNVADDLIQVQAPNGATTQFEYDDLGNLKQEISSDRGTTLYSHNDAGNVVSMTDARSITANYQYDSLNRITQVTYPTASENISYQYDNCQNGIGRLCQITDNSGVIDYQYDHWGNVTQTIKQEVDRSNGQSTAVGTYTTQYQYDAANRISQITYPSGRVVNYQRDAIGRIDGVTTQVSGEPVKDVLTSRTYRADGQWTSQQMGNGLVHNKTYDQQGRLTSHIAGSYNRTYQYDANGNILGTSGSLNKAYDYDPLDRLTEEMDSINNATIQFTYDENGNRTSENDDRRVEPGHPIPTGYQGPYLGMSYESNSNRWSQIQNQVIELDASGRTTYGSNIYSYNDAGRAKQIDNRGGIIGNYVYGADQLRTRKEVGGVTTIYHYDLAGNMLAESDSQAGHAVDYIYADGERLALKTETTQVASAAQVTNLALGKYAQQSSTFSYNSVDSSADLATDGNTDGTYAGGSMAITNYDSQAWWQVDLGAQSSIETVKIHNRTDCCMDRLAYFFVFVSETPFLNKTLAELYADQSIYQYFHNGTLSGSSLEIPLTDVDGRYVRVQLWSQDYLQLAEVEVIGTGIGGGSLESDPAESVHYYINDHLGTPQRMVDENQVMTWEAEYEAFGEAIVTRQIIVNNHRFPGQYYDAETGLHYNWHRYYNAEIGRYVASDPIGLDGGLNTYGYVGGNPIRSIDPTGQAATLVSPLVGGGGTAYGGCRLLGGCGSSGNGGSSYGENPFGNNSPNWNHLSDRPESDPVAPPITGEEICPVNDCDMKFIREVYYGGDTKTCIYHGTNNMFTFPQDKELPCMPVNLELCLVDTINFMGPKAKKIYNK